MIQLNEEVYANYHINNVESIICSFSSLELNYLKEFNPSDSIFEALKHKGDLYPLIDILIQKRLADSLNQLGISKTLKNFRKNYEKIRKQL